MEKESIKLPYLNSPQTQDLSIVKRSHNHAALSKSSPNSKTDSPPSLNRSNGNKLSKKRSHKSPSSSSKLKQSPSKQSATLVTSQKCSNATFSVYIKLCDENFYQVVRNDQSKLAIQRIDPRLSASVDNENRQLNIYSHNQLVRQVNIGRISHIFMPQAMSTVQLGNLDTSGAPKKLENTNLESPSISMEMEPKHVYNAESDEENYDFVKMLNHEQFDSGKYNGSTLPESDHSSSQGEIYDKVCYSYIANLLNERCNNQSILLYGKSPSQKSHIAGLTSQSFSNGLDILPTDGLAKRLLYDLFNQLEFLRDDTEAHQIHISLIELSHNGTLYDLLPNELSIYRNSTNDPIPRSRRKLVIKGNDQYFATYDDEIDVFHSRVRYRVKTKEEAFNLVRRGVELFEKEKEFTEFSHCLFFVYYTNSQGEDSSHSLPPSASFTGSDVISSICIGDLKGTFKSENTENKTFINVNRSLTFLSNVLAEMRKNSTMGNESLFRSHPLTKILKVYLMTYKGKNQYENIRMTRVALIITCDLSRFSLDLTVSSLRVASQCSKIRSNEAENLFDENPTIQSKLVRHSQDSTPITQDNADVPRMMSLEAHKRIQDLESELKWFKSEVRKLRQQMKTKDEQLKNVKKALNQRIETPTPVPTEKEIKWLVFEGNTIHPGTVLSDVYGIPLNGALYNGSILVSLHRTDFLSNGTHALSHWRTNLAQNSIVDLLWNFDHPNVLKVYGISKDGSTIVLEHAANGTLDAYLKSNKQLSNELKYTLSKEVASALEFFYSQQQVKFSQIITSNIYLDSNIHIKMNPGDIILSQENELSSYTGGRKDNTETQWLHSVPPEHYFAINRHLSGSIYQFGLVLYEIWVGIPAFSHLREKFSSQKELLEHIHNNQLRPDLHYDTLVDSKEVELPPDEESVPPSDPSTETVHPSEPTDKSQQDTRNDGREVVASKDTISQPLSQYSSEVHTSPTVKLPPEVIKLMQRCWDPTPANRPSTFKEIVTEIEKWEESIYAAQMNDIEVLIKNLKSLIAELMIADEIEKCTPILRVVNDIQSGIKAPKRDHQYLKEKAEIGRKILDSIQIGK